MADTGALPQNSDEGTGEEIQTPAATTAATGGQNIIGPEIEVDPAVVSNSINRSNEEKFANLWKKLENTDEEAYGSASSGYGSSTQSLTQSIQEYVFENGRRYHAYYGKDKNLLPTDEVNSLMKTGGSCAKEGFRRSKIEWICTTRSCCYCWIMSCIELRWILLIGYWMSVQALEFGPSTWQINIPWRR